MSVETASLFRANDYRDPFNGTVRPGKVHAFDPEAERTYCGKEERFCPGKRFQGALSLIDCLVCNKSIECRERNARWKAEYQERAVEREEQSRQWWQAYDAYLLTPAWRGRRSRVLKRANDVCEACLTAKAVQVHHLKYPYGLLPGSPEWLRAEKCHHLIAVCQQCHDDLHELKLPLETH